LTQRKRLRLGDLLVENRIITQEQLETALEQQKATGQKLGRVLVECGYVSEDELLRFLSAQLKVPLIDLAQFPLKPEVVRLIPEIHARRFRVIALTEEEDAVLVGMADPTNIFAYDELSRILKKTLKVAVVRESDLLRTLDTAYRQTEQISDLAEELGDELAVTDEYLNELADSVDHSDAPVVKLLQSLFEDAIRARASDIHIEPDEKALRIRQRVDGILHEHIIKEKRVANALVVKLKLMAGLDISEKRLPQDGRFSLQVHDRNIDVRLSTMPIYHGESVVMRLLDQTGGIPDLESLGMPDELREQFETAVRSPHGMVLVTGPTGSGKTTTLYSTLKLLNKPEVKIITVEDPVEYRLPRINQVQVNHEIDLGFARVLKAILRQDPDVVLIGEMRDVETVHIGLRAAMTGHMVLSTLHTNDAISTATRLLDMGAPGYLLASSLRAILAQRLIRRICDSCKTVHEPDPQEQSWLEKAGGTGHSYYIGSGCQKCHHTGYSGRIAVQELLMIDKELSLALASGDNREFIQAANLAAGYRPLGQVAMDLARKGVTTLEEVMRVAAEIEVDIENDAEPFMEEASLTLSSDAEILDEESPMERTFSFSDTELSLSSVDD